MASPLSSPEQALQLQQLLRACARQDRRALKQLYQLSSVKLFTLCRYMLRDEKKAEQALQASYLTIWRNAFQFDPHHTLALTWMAVIVRQQCIAFLEESPTDQTASTTAVTQHTADNTDELPEAIAELIGDLDADNSNEPDIILEPIDDTGQPLELTSPWSNQHAFATYLKALPEQERISITLAFYRGFSYQQLSSYLATTSAASKRWVRSGLSQLQRQLQT